MNLIEAIPAASEHYRFCEEPMTKTRKRVKHLATFEERLAEEARRFREAADKLPTGSKARELYLRRARQAETASDMNAWLSSPGQRHADPKR